MRPIRESIPDGYLAGHTTRSTDFLHLLKPGEWERESLCGVYLFGPSITGELYRPREFCEKCLRIALIRTGKV